MNLCLLHPTDLLSDGSALISDYRAEHVRQILKAEVGQSLCMGLVDGDMGYGSILDISPQGVRLALPEAWQAPPEKLPLHLLLALPRPKMLRRVMRTVAELGVAKLTLLNTWKVEKSYWHTPALTEDNLRQYLCLGLEQARDTVLPEICLEKRFKPFVEDRLPEQSFNSLKLLAHPGSAHACPRQLTEACTLAIGPEGGFTDYEVGMLEACGFQSIHLGSRILRVENAVNVLIAKLFD